MRSGVGDRPSPEFRPRGGATAGRPRLQTVSMGRETKILLGMLGLLSGVFVGVLSMKLLVPRPPVGAGPDVRVAGAADFAARELVEPPVPTPRPWDFTAAPPLVAAAPPAAEVPTETVSPAPPPAADASPANAFVAPADPPRFASRFAPAPEPFVPAADVSPAAPADDHDETGGAPQADVAVTSAAWEPPAETTPLRDAPSYGPAPDAALHPTPVPPADVSPGSHVVAPGESWWSLAERAYGDGRLYRALFAWNRALDARVALAPGTRLEIPPRDRLAAAWPRLVPADSP